MNRAKEEIIKSILEALPDIKTRIRYKAEVWNNFNSYLDEAIENGLIDIILNLNHGYPSKPTYLLTERGKQYLAAVNELLVLSK